MFESAHHIVPILHVLGQSLLNVVYHCAHVYEETQQIVGLVNRGNGNYAGLTERVRSKRTAPSQAAFGFSERNLSGTLCLQRQFSRPAMP
jgi:hypothetical protein